MTRRHHAFTLVEIMVTVAVFVILSNIVVLSYVSISKSTEKAIDAVDIYSRAGALLDIMRADLRTMSDACAINCNMNDQGSDHSGSLTFVAARSDITTTSMFRNQYPHPQLWVRWQIDADGGLRRAISPEPWIWIDSGDNLAASRFQSSHLRPYGDLSHPDNDDRLRARMSLLTPQREYRYFAARYDLAPDTPVPTDTGLAYQVDGSLLTAPTSGVFDNGTGLFLPLRVDGVDADGNYNSSASGGLMPMVTADRRQLIDNSLKIFDSVLHARIWITMADGRQVVIGDTAGRDMDGDGTTDLIGGVSDGSLCLPGLPLDGSTGDDLGGSLLDASQHPEDDAPDGVADERQRPVRVRMDLLVHSIPGDAFDDSDIDGDGDFDERLASAVRQSDVEATRVVIESLGHLAIPFTLDIRMD